MSVKPGTPYHLMTTREMMEALKDKKIPTEEDCLILAERLKWLIDCSEYIYAIDATRPLRPKNIC